MVLIQIEVPDALHQLIQVFKKDHQLRNNREAIIIIIESYLKSYNNKEVQHG